MNGADSEFIHDETAVQIHLIQPVNQSLGIDLLFSHSFNTCSSFSEDSVSSLVTARTALIIRGGGSELHEEIAIVLSEIVGLPCLDDHSNGSVA